jgi:lipopolysaccharide transport system ATP-binding protein
MSDIAVRVENLGKCYQIGQAKSGDFRQSFGSWMDKLRGRSNGHVQDSKEFWALKDINFEIKKGEAVGIIGRNGAGKSTLLKILSRITEPTKGRFEINGRVSSLLEVGTGFHPELSGRENIYLNGTILGMKRREIKAKFDEIVAFSGVEKFIDTPVKHYSSGMKVRLAFSVAAHLEPEILIVDEVLAVGDAEFQKKCLGKMDEVSKNEGRTVLFVSHNMGAVQKLCTKGLLLGKGELWYQGDLNSTVNEYLRFRFKDVGRLRNRIDRKGSGEIFVEKIEIKNEAGEVIDMAHSGQKLNIYFSFRNDGLYERDVIVSIQLRNQYDQPLFLTHNRATGDKFDCLGVSGCFICKLEKLPLPPGTYYVSYSILCDGKYLDGLDNAERLEVTNGDFYGSGEVPPATHGLCLVDANWEIKSKMCN